MHSKKSGHLSLNITPLNLYLGLLRPRDATHNSQNDLSATGDLWLVSFAFMTDWLLVNLTMHVNVGGEYLTAAFLGNFLRIQVILKRMHENQSCKYFPRRFQNLSTNFKKVLLKILHVLHYFWRIAFSLLACLIRIKLFLIVLAQTIRVLQIPKAKF